MRMDSATIILSKRNYWRQERVVAVDFQSEGAHFIQQEKKKIFLNSDFKSIVSTSYMPYSSAICGEIQCTNSIEKGYMQ